MPDLPRLSHIEAEDPKFVTLRKRTMNNFYLLAGASALSVFIVGGLGFIFAILSMAWLLISLSLVLYHRNQIENFHHYRQTEALFGLHSLLDIRYPLPPMRLWVMSPDFASLIATYIINEKPRHVVELGSGVSTLIASYAIEKAGSDSRITSFEHIENFADQSRENLNLHKLSSYTTVKHAPLKSTSIKDEIFQWYNVDLDTLEPINILVVDGPPETTQPNARYPALPMLYDKLADGALILVDDYMRGDEHAMVNKWLAQYELEVVDTLANEKGAIILRKSPQVDDKTTEPE